MPRQTHVVPPDLSEWDVVAGATLVIWARAEAAPLALGDRNVVHGGFPPMHDPVPIAAIDRVNLLADRMRLIQKIMQKP